MTAKKPANKSGIAKAWGGVFTEATDKRMELFSESISYDYRLYKEDIAGSIAHARMLSDVGLLTAKEFAQIEKNLKEIEKEIEAGDFEYTTEKEDIHMHIEADLIRRQKEAEAKTYEAIKEAEARKAEAEALRFAMEQEAEGIRAKGLAEAQAIEKKAEAQRKMGEASVIEMYLNALPEVVRNAATPLAQTDKIVMYGDGNSTKLVKDVMNSAGQIMEGMKESTGIDPLTVLN